MNTHQLKMIASIGLLHVIASFLIFIFKGGFWPILLVIGGFIFWGYAYTEILDYFVEKKTPRIIKFAGVGFAVISMLILLCSLIFSNVNLTVMQLILGFSILSYCVVVRPRIIRETKAEEEKANVKTEQEKNQEIWEAKQNATWKYLFDKNRQNWVYVLTSASTLEEFEKQEAEEEAYRRMQAQYKRINSEKIQQQEKEKSEREKAQRQQAEKDKAYKERERINRERILQEEKEKSEREKAQRQQAEKDKAYREKASSKSNIRAEDPFETLGIPRNASNVVINDAFRKLSLKWHPDKFAKYDDQRVMEMANEKYVRIKDAYEKIKKEKGWN